MLAGGGVLLCVGGQTSHESARLLALRAETGNVHQNESPLKDITGAHETDRAAAEMKAMP